MKNLKTLLLFSFLFVLFTPNALSETIEKHGREVKPVQFIVKGGMNISRFSVTYDHAYSIYGGLEERSGIGYNFGLVVDITLGGGNFYFQPGLSFSAKGTKVTDIDYGESSMNALYLQVPVLFAYKFGLERWGNSLNIAAGPYFAYGIGGKVSGLADTFGKEGICNRPDVGLGMEFSFEMRKFVFSIGYEYGFTNTIKRQFLERDEHWGDASYHYSNNYLGVAYKF